MVVYSSDTLKLCRKKPKTPLFGFLKTLPELLKAPLALIWPVLWDLPAVLAAKLL